MFCLAIEERFLESGRVTFEGILKSCICLQPWDFGFALSQPTEKKPEFYVLGLDDGNLTTEEQERLNKWHGSPPEIRLQKIRDVYPFNVVSDAQLKAQISVSKTLEDIIREDCSSSLSYVEDSQLWLWKVQADGLSRLREKLVHAGVLIT